MIHLDTDQLEELFMITELRDSSTKAKQQIQLLIDEKYKGSVLVRPNGTPIPKHLSILQVDEKIVIKDYTFKVAYMNDTTLVLEPVGPIIIGEE